MHYSVSLDIDFREPLKVGSLNGKEEGYSQFDANSESQPCV